MVKINLFTYYISLENDQHKEVNLTKIKYTNLFPESIPKSLQEILNNLFNITNTEINYFTKDNKVMQIKYFRNEPENIFYGEFDYGTYGTAHVVKDINTNKKVSEISTTEYAGTPYYFIIYIPQNRKKALLILESKNNVGIKGLFEHGLKKYVKETTSENLKLKIESFLPEQIIDKYIDYGTLNKIRFRSSKIPVDELDILENHEPEEGYVELKVHLYKEKRQIITDKLKSLIKNKNQEATKYSKIPGTNIETDDIKLEIDLNGSERTFTIDNLENAIPAVDITNDVEPLGEDGHRTFEKIHEAASNYLKDILSEDN